MKQPEKNIQVYLSIFFGLFHFQSGALKDVAQQNPIPSMINIQVYLSIFFGLFHFQSGALKDVAQQNPSEITMYITFYHITPKSLCFSGFFLYHLIQITSFIRNAEGYNSGLNKVLRIDF